MRVFLAGASGAIGSRLVPQLIDAGHEVIGTHTSPSSGERVRALGAKPVLLDLLDARAVRKAVLEAEPEAIVHEATALANAKWGRNFDKAFATTNELRTKGTDALLAAAREAGVRRFVAQSFASMRNAREGGMVKSEDDPLDPNPMPSTRQGQAAMRHLEQAVTDGGGYSSWVHLDDAAAATVLALEHDGPAIYNIVDAEPAPVSVWLPELATIVGAKPPHRFPRPLAQLVAGEVIVVMATE